MEFISNVPRTMFNVNNEVFVNINFYLKFKVITQKTKNQQLSIPKQVIVNKKKKPFTAFNSKPLPLIRKNNPTEDVPASKTISRKKPGQTFLDNIQKSLVDVNKLPSQKDVILKTEDSTKEPNKEQQRKAKQFEDNKNIFEDDIDNDDDEPTPEPEPSSHSGNPRYHAFHSCKLIGIEISIYK